MSHSELVETVVELLHGHTAVRAEH